MGKGIPPMFLAMILAVFLVSSCQTTGPKVEPATYEIGDHEGPDGT